MASVRSFAPIAAPDARLLILGSMPGEASLTAQQYYAHPHNAFWPIVCALIGVDPQLPYAARTRALQAAGIALWDVLASCEREGSLDTAIRKETVVVNDFAAFFAAHPRITDVLFNGGMAETSYRRHVLPTLAPRPGHVALRLERLPSTSPANASVSRAEKLAVWKKVFAERGITVANNNTQASVEGMR